MKEKPNEKEMKKLLKNVKKKKEEEKEEKFIIRRELYLNKICPGKLSTEG